ncbi:cytidylate kinase family protein [Candidatus Dojkabacteria bacterium]|nr:cytidylate kinase family protein [Candidatus Dojkabacteria bacterium]
MQNNTSNIFFSSWPSAGGTTAARFIALIFEMQYVYAGGVLKYWADSMGFDSKSAQINEWAAKYHQHWDFVWENFIAHYALNSRNTLIEGMTAGFMIHSDKVFKIFIKADLEARIKRAQGDERTETVQERDEFLRKEWRARFGVDIFDDEQIERNYDLILDTTNIGIREVWVVILKKLHEKGVRSFKLEQKLDELENIYVEYETNAQYLKDKLKEKRLIFESPEILRIIKTKHTDLIKNIPDEMKAVM